jgi:TetR/AcrR family transcriptional repressor of nem operon
MLSPTEVTAHRKPLASAGRPRQFARDEALQKAIEVFWCKGFEATSLDDLLAGMGLSKSSFYACFGSKQALYDEAIRAYAERFLDVMGDLAKSAADPMAAVLAILATMADTEGGSQGCFIVNTVTELALHNPELTAYCQAHIARMTEVVADLLVQSGFTPGLANDRAAAALALVFGLVTLRKAGFPAQRLGELLAQLQPLLALP